MFGLLKSKEEKRLKKGAPEIAGLIFKQIHQSFLLYVDEEEDKDKFGAYIFRVNSIETHAYIFSFIEAYCRAALPDQLSGDVFGKIYMTVTGYVWSHLFDNEFMKAIPAMSLNADNNPRDVSSCWSGYVRSAHETSIRDISHQGRSDFASHIVYGVPPCGLSDLLSAAEWGLPSDSRKEIGDDELLEEQDSSGNGQDLALEAVLFPDIGDFPLVSIIEVHIFPGSTVEKDETLIVVESDKAVMDIPSPFDGVIDKVYVEKGEEISEAIPICLVRTRRSVPEEL